jgi:hypothetical protein
MASTNKGTDMLATTKTASALAIALAAFAFAAPAEAGGRGKEFYSQTYVSDRPLHGFEGRAPYGDYYCSYVRVPVHKMINGRMKVVAWTLTQNCY